MSVDPLEPEEVEETERLSIDLPASELEWLQRYANYRTALNEAQGKKRKKWTRKSAAEAYVAAQIRQMKASMAKVFEELGELPSDEKAMLAYAKRVVAATEPTPKKTSK
jgi:hypothetical protein